MKPFPAVAALSAALALGALCAGCQGYTRGSSVPEALRTVHVAAFENRTQYPKVGAIATQQLLDALIEDGTFRPVDYASARLRVQGVMAAPRTDAVSYDRNNIIVPDEYRLTLRASLYVHDALTGETLINGKTFSATETMMTRGDYQTGVTDALPRVSRKLAQTLLAALQSLEAELPDPPAEAAEGTPSGSGAAAHPPAAAAPAEIVPAAGAAK